MSVLRRRSTLRLFDFGTLGLLLILSTPAFAHEVRPAYLELRETGSETYAVIWKVPARGDNRLSLHVRFPEQCAEASRRTVSPSDNAVVDRVTMACEGGLAGRVIAIDGLTATMTDVLVRIEHADGVVQTSRLTPAQPLLIVEAAPGGLGVARTYLALGVEHILGGIDHLLFVLALLLITRGAWRVIKTVTAFTVAHSMTLALATLGFVHVPQAPVEATIALSIVLVAAEIVRERQGLQGITARAPWIVAFAFGLLHGFGFAGALSETGLPANHIPLALLFFNVGVEAGQLAFIAMLLAALAIARWSQRHRSTGSQAGQEAWTARLLDPSTIRLVSAYAIGSVAMLWVIQRIAAFNV